MVYHGHGFTWTELYNMPVWLRTFYYKKIEEAILKKNEKENPKNTPKPPKIQRPGVAPV
jgi:hypothetical protein